MLGDYLVSVSKSIVVDRQAAAPASVMKSTRNRLDLLLLVNDILHTDKFHRRSNTKQGIFSDEFTSFTLDLVELASSFIHEKDSPAEKKLRALLNYWAVNGLVSAEDLQSLQGRAEESLLLAQGGMPIRKRTYLLPAYHGDRIAPWHDLPASYMLEQMIANPKKAIDPSRIKVAKLDKKPVSPHVRKLLDDYFENIDLKYLPTGDNPSGGTKKYNLSLDPLGQLIKQNKETGEAAVVCNGYGWSAKFCRDMQSHGVAENIKILREDMERMEGFDGAQDAPQRRHDERRYSRSPRRRRQSSSDSEYRRERGKHGRSHSRSYSRSRRGSRSSYDSHRSRSRSYDKDQDRRHSSARDDRRHTNDRGQGYDERGSRSSQPRPRPSDRNSSQSAPSWDRGNNSSHNTSGSADPGKLSAPLQPSPSFGPQGAQAPFGVPPFPPPPLPPGQFPGPFPTGYPPPFPPPQFPLSGGFPGGVMPPVPPPNFHGSHHPSAAGMSNIPNAPYNTGNQPGNYMGQGSGSGHSQNAGGFQGSRGGYRGNFQRGGYNNNNSRGGYGGHNRGQRGGRY